MLTIKQWVRKYEKHFITMYSHAWGLFANKNAFAPCYLYVCVVLSDFST